MKLLIDADGCPVITHKNHGAEFWAHIAEFVPDYKAHRKWLKTNGGKLIMEE